MLLVGVCFVGVCRATTQGGDDGAPAPRPAGRGGPGRGGEGLRLQPFSYLRFQSLDFEHQTYIKFVLETSGDHLLI